MEKLKDMHTHSIYSDGTDTVEDILDKAKESNIDTIAITDHDGCQAFPHVYGEIGKYNKGLKAPYKELIAELEAKLNAGEKLEDSDIEALKDHIKNFKENIFKI